MTLYLTAMIILHITPKFSTSNREACDSSARARWYNTEYECV